MKKSSPKVSAKFKMQVAIEALKELEALSELAKRFELYPNQIFQEKPLLREIEYMYIASLFNGEKYG